jgi:NifU-like protein
LVCSCFGVSEQKIRRLIRENHLTSAEEVTAYSKAGGGCGSCLAQIEDLIAAVLAETDTIPSEDSRNSKGNSQNQTEPSPAAPSPLTTLQKIARIQAVLDEEVRPLLLADGGDVELYDLEGDQVWVRLKGSCTTCPSQQNTLRLLIETRLQEQVWPTLTVHAL